MCTLKGSKDRLASVCNDISPKRIHEDSCMPVPFDDWDREYCWFGETACQRLEAIVADFHGYASNYAESYVPRKAEFLEDGSGVFWIQGTAGTGKSTLMRYLVDQCLTRHPRSHDEKFFYFFNSQQWPSQKAARAWLVLLLDGEKDNNIPAEGTDLSMISGILRRENLRIPSENHVNVSKTFLVFQNNEDEKEKHTLLRPQTRLKSQMSFSARDHISLREIDAKDEHPFSSGLVCTSGEDFERPSEERDISQSWHNLALLQRKLLEILRLTALHFIDTGGSDRERGFSLKSIRLAESMGDKAYRKFRRVYSSVRKQDCGMAPIKAHQDNTLIVTGDSSDIDVMGRGRQCDLSDLFVPKILSRCTLGGILTLATLKLNELGPRLVEKLVQSNYSRNAETYSVLGWSFVYFSCITELSEVFRNDGDFFQREFILTGCTCALLHSAVRQSGPVRALTQILPPWIMVAMVLSWVLHQVINRTSKGPSVFQGRRWKLSGRADSRHARFDQ